MDINITNFVQTACPMDYSASVAEIGQFAGTITWLAALESGYIMLDTHDKREAFREYLEPFGAWDEEEIAGWNHTELNALFVQFVASAMREAPFDDEDYSSIFEDEDGESYFELIH